MCTAMCKTDNYWELTVSHRQLSSVLCGDLDGWNEDGWWEVGPEGGDIYIHIADSLHCTTEAHTIL